MNITYYWKVRFLNRTKIYGLENIISHVHFDYVGTSDTGKVAQCQGTLPFELKPTLIYDPVTGKQKTIPAVFDKDNYIPYDQIDDAVIISWLESSVPQNAISVFKEIISQKLAETD